MDLDNLLPLYAGCEGGSQRDLAPAQLNNETASVPVDDTALVAITAHADTEADDEVTDLAQEPPLSRQDGLTEPYTAYKALELRKEVYRRGLRPTKKGPQANCTKAGYMKQLRNFDRTYQLYDQIAVGSGGQKRKASPDQTIKTKHCMFRLLNVIFSDDFATRLTESNGPVTHMDLDRGAVNERSQFWTDIADSFAQERLEYGWVVANHPKFSGIDH
ncbi:hypothetical protein GN958_ATG22332 [Phytophthora infestans]|uniref:Uncharacterized protein n=1 Tax=Phytophthora infestans TaxID=4787 RepID=A0A8S9TJC8_PHYIN|nr:hypothetical protein GN958_ATG22332 [Phytophthora infestans]